MLLYILPLLGFSFSEKRAEIFEEPAKPVSISTQWDQIYPILSSLAIMRLSAKPHPPPPRESSVCSFVSFGKSILRSLQFKRAVRGRSQPVVKPIVFRSGPTARRERPPLPPSQWSKGNVCASKKIAKYHNHRLCLSLAHSFYLVHFPYCLYHIPFFFSLYS